MVYHNVMVSNVLIQYTVYLRGSSLGVPLHSLVCHNNSMSELATLMVTKYYILGLWGQIFVLLRVFVKTQWRFEPLYPYCTGAGLMTLPLIVIFS